MRRPGLRSPRRKTSRNWATATATNSSSCGSWSPAWDGCARCLVTRWKRHRDKWEFTFKKTTADSRALAEIMHWLVVRAAIAEWCRMFSPTDTAEAKAETEELEADLDELLSRPAIPVKERRRIVLEDAPTEITYTFIP